VKINSSLFGLAQTWFSLSSQSLAGGEDMFASRGWMEQIEKILSAIEYKKTKQSFTKMKPSRVYTMTKLHRLWL
jgi:hypothetical protein